MQKNPLIRKGLVFAVIFLFLGVALAPSINNQVVKASVEDELVEVTSEVCGIKGFGNTTIKLTRQHYQDLEQYLDDFRARLNTSTTRAETEEIYKDAIVELDKYGLLGGLSIHQAQNLIFKNNQVSEDNKLLNKYFFKNPGSIKFDERFCLIAGKTLFTWSISLASLLVFACLLPVPIFLEIFFTIFDDIFNQFLNNKFLSLLVLFLYFSPVIGGLLFTALFPIELFGTIFFGIPQVSYWGIEWEDSMGWIFTLNSDGFKNWSGPIPRGSVALGFSGIKIYTPLLKMFFIGSALAFEVNT